ncbi:MAG: ABC transporter ATP-binding protein [Gammaproteobacteria bacterium]|nr:ABC transporter ATP-binding protein [Gammaproteobacteria bacterium]
MADTASVLELAGVSAGYADTVVLEEIDLRVSAGEVVSIIGRNGVGKTTLLATIMGHTTLHAGRIDLDGRDVGRQKTYRRVWQGLGYAPQEREIFPSLTVTQNLAIAARDGEYSPESVFDLFPRLVERRQHLGSQLSGGEQQMLAIARALVGNPRVLLMDEPSEGLAPIIVEQLQETMTRLRDTSAMAIVLVEQNSRIALEFAERCLVMNRGRITRDGPSQELRDDHELLHRLIGVEAGNQDEQQERRIT